MGLVERIKELSDSKNITFAELERHVGLSNGQIRRWNDSSPKVENVEKVAEYFNVSVDFLLGRKEGETELRKALVGVMSFDGEEMTEHDREAIIAFMLGRKGK